jgi:hypothetical protein
MFPKTASPPPILLAIDEETTTVANYMNAQFSWMRNWGASRTSVRHPDHWSLDFAIEVDLALDVIARAFNNQGVYMIR